MPELRWIGKDAVVGHHHKVTYRLLRCDPALSAGDHDAGNLVVQGDNLLALKALLPYYAGKVKCIYIDPPYNTGNEGWIYNDNMKGTEIEKWMVQVVGREGEDLSRHDKWLCMMYPRLALLRDFLTEDGAIFVSIDENEGHYLRIVMDTIFGAQNFLCAFAWEKRYAPPPDTRDIGYLHETILAYRRSARFQRHLLPLTQDQTGRYRNPDNDPRGPWKAMDYTCRYTAEERPNLYYPITQPTTGNEVWPKRTRVWSMSREVHERNVAENRIWWGRAGTSSVPALKNFLSEIQQGMMPVSLLKYGVVGHTDEAAKELRALVPGVKFTPKPTKLIRHFLQIAAEKESIILDSFAGSGTTGHAVLAQNNADGGNRRFILVEMDEGICRNVTAQRMRKVIEGYGDTPGLGGGFQFCKLGTTLFDEAGSIRGEVRFPDLAAHVFFTETGRPIPKRAESKTPLLGTHQGKAVYLLFNGVLGDRRPAGGNVLTHDVAQDLPPHPDGTGPRVVYGEACRLGPKSLTHYGITFRQIPFDLKVD